MDVSQPLLILRPFIVIVAAPDPAEVGRIVPIEGALSIGRSSEASLVIKDSSLSRRHLEIVHDGASCIVRDVGSRNGTSVNGARIETIALVSGDQIAAGGTLVQYLDNSTASELWVKRALAGSGVALWDFDAATDELAFSEHVDLALELPPSSLGRKRVSIAACVHPDQVDSVRRALTRCDGRPLEIEVRLSVGTALERWVVLRGQAIGEPGRVAGTIVDVTVRRRRESTLARTAAMFDSFLDGVALTDEHGAIVDLNARMATTFQLTRAQIIGRDLLTAVGAEEPPRLLGDATAALAESGRWTTKLRLGRDARFEVFAFPLRTDRGEAAGTAWVFRDVSEQERLTAQVAFLDRLVSLGTLSAGVAHEINNPLMYILGNAELARDALAAQGQSTTVELVDEIVQGAQRIAAIVDDLRTFSRAHQASEPEPLDVRVAIERAIKVAGVTIRQSAQLVVDDRSTRRALAIEARLGQVLINLLINAAQAIPSTKRDATITVRADDDRDGVAIEVIDCGHGMAPEVMARAFEPYFTTKPMVGTGLGLSICHGLVTGMGGTISLASRVGEGTTVRVWLPGVPAVPTRPQVPHVAGGEPQATRLRVLFIDDEPMVLRTTARLLAPHEVVTAVGFRAGAERLLVQRESYDVVLCDLMMPDGTGMDLHARLAAERPEVLPSLVFVTGGALAGRSEDFLRTTPNRHILKPMSRETLRRVVMEVGAGAR